MKVFLQYFDIVRCIVKHSLLQLYSIYRELKEGCSGGKKQCIVWKAGGNQMPEMNTKAMFKLSYGLFDTLVPGIHE